MFLNTSGMCFNSPDEPHYKCDISNVCGPQQVQEAEGLLACWFFDLWRDRDFSVRSGVFL